MFAKNFSKINGPLAYRMAPLHLEDFVGQEHLIGKDGILKKLIEKDRVPSSLFFGPPGTGKTSLAKIIARKTSIPFFLLNASISSSTDVRKVLKEAESFYRKTGRPIMLFLDEIHRFNRLQQEILLPFCEQGKIILIGSTVLNPFFVIDKALLSRLSPFEFKPIDEKGILMILKMALRDKERGLGSLNINIEERSLELIAESAEGDARRALNILELLVETCKDSRVTEEDFKKLPLFFRYDRKGDEHYDRISAFIKSLRGSDADASLYWLFRMLESGEDPRFIMRRMLIFASEDVGLAEPSAIQVVQSCAAGFEMVGLPEGEFLLALAALFLSLCPKSNSVLRSISNTKEVLKTKKFPVPVYLKNSPLFDKEQDLKKKETYLYPYSDQNAIFQKYLPEPLHIVTLLGIGKEKIFKEELEKIRRIRWKRNE